MKNRKLLPQTSFLIIILALSACSKSETPKLSFEEDAHKRSINSCVSLMVEAGSKWTQGDQVMRVCEQNNLTRPQIARYDIMEALKSKDLIPKGTSSFYDIPVGACKDSADRYLELQEAMYQENPGQERTAHEAESIKILEKVKSGECPAIPKPVAKVS